MTTPQEETFGLPLLNPSSIAFWKYPILFNDGCLAIPCSLLHLYAHLKPYPLSAGEVLFVLHLMEHSRDGQMPSYKTLSSRMGVTHKMVRRYAKSLEDKSYMRRELRAGYISRLDLTPLFDALRKASTGIL